MNQNFSSADVDQLAKPHPQTNPQPAAQSLSYKKVHSSDTLSDEIKPWSIRGVAPEARNAAIAAAGRNGMQMGEWLTRAILVAIKSERDASRSVTIVAEAARSPLDPSADLDATERLIAMARSIAQDTQSEIPRSIARLAHRVIRDRLRAARDRGLTKQPDRLTDCLTAGEMDDTGGLER